MIFVVNSSIPQNIGRSLELFFIDGRPGGLLVAELFNWTGHVLLAPRTQIAEALARNESGFTGTYILLGEKDGAPLAYIGEGEDISARIRSHDSKKDWWTRAIFVTTSDNKLNKAHVRYLEARLIEQARSVGRMALDNGNDTKRPSISESMQANMEGFLDNLHIVLPAIGIDLFVESKRSSSPSVIEPSITKTTRFELNTPRHGLHAKARLEGSDFIVEKGSLARTEWVSKAKEQHSSYAGLRRELEATSILVAEGDHAVFASDYAFSSTSAAAAIITGRPANGTTEWKLEGSKKTYKEWEADQLAQQG